MTTRVCALLLVDMIHLIHIVDIVKLCHYNAFCHFSGSLDGPCRTDGKVRPASGLGLRDRAARILSPVSHARTGLEPDARHLPPGGTLSVEDKVSSGGKLIDAKSLSSYKKIPLEYFCN